MEYQLAVIVLVTIACVISYGIFIFKLNKKKKSEAYVAEGKRLLDLSLWKNGKEKEDLLRLCIKKCEKAIEFCPKNNSAYLYFLIALQHLEELSEGKENEDLLCQSKKILNKIDLLSCADNINYGYFSVIVGEGDDLRKLAESQEGKEKEDSLRQSIKKYYEALEMAKEYNINFPGYFFSNTLSGLCALNTAIYQIELELNPENPKIHCDYGLALLKLSDRGKKEGFLQECILQECIEYFEKALELDDKYAIAYAHLGRVLLNLSLFKNEYEQESLLRQCIEKFEKALKLDTSISIVYVFMGLALHFLAGLKNGEEKESLLRSCVEKYLKILEINPTYIVYARLGCALHDLSALKYGKEREDLLRKSEEMIKKASFLEKKHRKGY